MALSNGMSCPLVWLMHLPLSNIPCMTSSRIFSTLLLLFISMTFLSSPMTPRNIVSMSVKYSNDSNNTNFIPTPTNVISPLIQLNTSATFFPKTVSPCPPLEFKLFKTGLNIKDIQSFLCFAKFYWWFIANYLTLLFCSPTPQERAYIGISPKKPDNHLKPSI